MIRVLRDPSGLMRTLSSPTGIGALTGAGGLLNAFSGLSEGRAQAAQLRAEANVSQVQGDRALRDFQLDSQRQMGRIMALAGAGGLSIDGASIISSSAAELARGETRLRQDTRLRRESLLRSSRATRQRSFGNFLSDLSSASVGALDAYETAAQAREG